MSSWICDGIPQGHPPSAQGHVSRSPATSHEPYENFGQDCVVCGLPKSAVLKQRQGLITLARITATKRSRTIASVGLAGAAVGGLLLGSSWLWPSQSCAQNRSRPSGECTPIEAAVSPAKTLLLLAQHSAQNSASHLAAAPSITQYVKFAEVPNVPSMRMRYGGSTSLSPLKSQMVVDSIQQVFPGFELHYTDPVNQPPGSTAGIQMLLQDQINVALSSRHLKPQEYDAARRQGFALEQVPIAIDGIAVYGHPAIVKVAQQLTTMQLQDIFTGKVTNWQDLGGPDLPIAAFSHDPATSGTAQFFLDNVLLEQPFGETVQVDGRNTAELFRAVANTPGSISYASAAEVCAQQPIGVFSISKVSGSTPASPCEAAPAPALRALSATDKQALPLQVNQQALASASYAITRTLFLILRRDGRDSERAGVAYANLMLSDEGQQLMAQSGFAPIRTPHIQTAHRIP